MDLNSLRFEYSDTCGQLLPTDSNSSDVIKVILPATYFNANCNITYV